MLEPVLKADLLLLAEKLARHHAISLDTVSTRIAHDSGFFRRIKQNSAASFTLRKYDEIMLNFRAEWPAGLAWPSHIARPRVSRGKREGRNGGARRMAG